MAVGLQGISWQNVLFQTHARISNYCIFNNWEIYYYLDGFKGPTFALDAVSLYSDCKLYKISKEAFFNNLVALFLINGVYLVILCDEDL